MKNKIIFNFVKFVAIKKGLTTNFFDPSLLLLFLNPGSEIRDQEWVKIRIPDPQHCFVQYRTYLLLKIFAYEICKASILLFLKYYTVYLSFRKSRLHEQRGPFEPFERKAGICAIFSP